MTEDWSVPPSPEGVSTNEAAQLFGCRHSHFLKVMRDYGVTPIREYVSGRRVDKLWNPAVVRQVKASHALAKRAARGAHSVKYKQVNNELAKFRRREARLERERQRILARLKERQCTTTK